MRVISAFDGMSCAQIALRNLGIQPTEYIALEIDKFAVNVTQKNFPNTIQHGDIREATFDGCDLLIGGSPCQGFSFSGKGLNFDDERSKLFFEFVRLLKESKPTYFLLENVVMSKESENIITDNLEVEPVKINSSSCSAQNRKRLYWTNIDIRQFNYRNVTWNSIRETGIEEMYYSTKAMQWLARHAIRNQKTLKLFSTAEKMQMLEASHYKKYSSQRFFGIIDTYPPHDKWSNTTHTEPLSIKVRDGKLVINEETILSDSAKFPDRFGLRFITPRECERLQTVPDDYTAYVSDTQRYKMLGNGFTVKVIEHILGGMR